MLNGSDDEAGVKGSMMALSRAGARRRGRSGRERVVARTRWLQRQWWVFMCGAGWDVIAEV